MKKIRVLHNHKRKSNAELAERFNTVINSTSNNPYFPTPDVDMLRCRKTLSIFETKIAEAADGGRLHNAELRSIRLEVEDSLDMLALYVDRISNGNEVIILSSGFEVTKGSSKPHRPDFQVSCNGHSGSVKLQHKLVKSARAWAWQYCTDPMGTSQWVLAGISTQTMFEINNLKPGTKYWFRASYITPSGQSEWCDPHAIIVQ